MEKFCIRWMLVIVFSFLSSAFAGDLVQWTDEKGNINFTDSLENVPAKYRNQAKQEQFQGDQLPRSSSRSEGGFSAADAGVLRSMLETGAEKSKPNGFEVPYEAYEGTAQR